MLWKLVISLFIWIYLEVSYPRTWKLVQFNVLWSLSFLNACESITRCILHQYMACIIVHSNELLTSELSCMSIHHLRNIWVLYICWHNVTLGVFYFETLIRHLLVHFILNILLQCLVLTYELIKLVFNSVHINTFLLNICFYSFFKLLIIYDRLFLECNLLNVFKAVTFQYQFLNTARKTVLITFPLVFISRCIQLRLLRKILILNLLLIIIVQIKINFQSSLVIPWGFQISVYHNFACSYLRMYFDFTHKWCALLWFIVIY